ncbi:O-linked N-acetylglucosamine transferase, SPINDLY family protein [Vreelandella alkaliphila]|uniref:O-linked N-acetylglucosamine transferase, SPINDLY family protein n=1 Tax=Vreelandella alkaliphila TaxID=272774 RepID=UPI003F9BB2D0
MAKKKSCNKSVKKNQHKRSMKGGQASPSNALGRYENLGVPSEQAQRFMALFDNKKFSEAQAFAHQLTQNFPCSAFAWKALGTSYLESGDIDEALVNLHKAVEKNNQDPLSLTSLAAVYYQQGENEQAVRYQKKAVDLDPEYAPAQYRLAQMLHSAGKPQLALPHIKKAIDAGHDPFQSKILLGVLLYNSKYFKQALEVYHRLEEDYPPNASVFNNLGNLYKDLGEYKKAEQYYQNALELDPGFVMAYSNTFFSKHYNPVVTQQEIIDFATQWDSKFSLSKLPPPTNTRDVAKPLRIGMISSGFRLHPVGQMIATALENSRPDIQYYGYSTTDHTDFVTQKIRDNCKQWQPVRHLSQEALAARIRNDQIDILVDLSGHGDGSCMQAISMRPAPLCIKWVGGLVNTMGVESIDYLLSDHIETPDGVDDQYTEKLIRLPDDYICYMPCPYAPATTSVPALKNRYITLGCLNNPAKIGAELLAEWAELMHRLPESRLLLRGAQYASEDFCRRIWDEMAQQGIEQYRVLLEGPTNHKDFIGTYQRIDIALDTWPYSGGLTTCEALLMGVPVVTLPGPTFAGRHSATHLINAGLQELVTSSWDEYRQRVLELANDLPNLAVIRAGLRTILNYSPVCDAPRFANHFNNALRAIWVRYCEGKAPEALTFNKEGEMWFADEDMLVELPECSAEGISVVEAFEWKIDKPITIIDNAAVLPRDPAYVKWMSSGDLVVISFDPASLLANKVEELKEYGELHHYPHALLGDGQSITLYATLDAEKGSTLKSLPEDQQPEYLREKLKVLAKLPINTLALDSIEGLPSMDMLVLDDLHDAIKVLENGERSLREALLIQVRVAFQPSYERQPNLAELQHWMARHGFRFYCFNNERHQSHFSQSVPQGQRQATELVSVDAIFLPSYNRMAELSEDQRIKLAFLLHTIYGIRDMAFELLTLVDKKKADDYLREEVLTKVEPYINPEIPLAGKVEASVEDGLEEFPLPDAPHMSTAERKLLKRGLKKAKQYFEFGSGGSTVWAVKEGLTVQGVESDANWVNALKDKLGEQCQVETVDIGATKAWGFPVSMDAADKFPAYSQAIAKYSQPFDFILVDGRFRVACTMSAILHILDYSDEASDARIFIHDFWNRPHYHVVLQFLETVEKVETAGLFKISKNINREEVVSVWEQYAKQPQ